MGARGQPVRRTGTGRFVLALVVSFAVYGRCLGAALKLGDPALGGPGVVAAVVVLGFGLALLFTAIYDGPGAIARLLTRTGGKTGS
jgi:hypothetical protein